MKNFTVYFQGKQIIEGFVDILIFFIVISVIIIIKINVIDTLQLQNSFHRQGQNDNLGRTRILMIF